MDPSVPPPAYRPEWDPNYTQPGAAATAAPGSVELLPMKGDPGGPTDGHPVPGSGYPGPYGAGGYPTAPPAGGDGYPPPPSAPGYTAPAYPSGPVYPPPPGQTYPPPQPGTYPPPPGQTYPPPPGQTYPPPPGQTYPPPPGQTYPPPAGGVSPYPPRQPVPVPPGNLPSEWVQYQDRFHSNDPDFSNTPVTLVNREEYTAPVFLAQDQFDPRDAEAKVDSCTVYCCFIFWHGAFYLWLAICIWQLVERNNVKHYDRLVASGSMRESDRPKQHYNEGLFIAAVVLTCVTYVCMLLETCCSRTDDYLSTKRTLEEATSEVERVRKAVIKVIWRAKCFHSQSEYVTDSDGRSETRSTEVVTHVEQHTVEYASLVDASPDFSALPFHKNDIVRVEFSKSFGFVDEDSRVQFERERDDFRQRNKARDTDVEFSEVIEFSKDFPDHMAVWTRGDSTESWWVRRSWLWGCTLVLCGWLYRACFRCRTHQAKYTFFKLIKK